MVDVYQTPPHLEKPCVVSDPHSSMCQHNITMCEVSIDDTTGDNMTL